MAKHGKKYQASAKIVNPNDRYTLEEGCKLVKQTAKAKFDESVDVAINLGVDPRHADQQVRGAVVLPNGTGKTVRIAVFAKGQKAKDAEEAGADIVGADDLVEQIEKGVINFDKVVATPDMMALVGKLGKVLGPRGLMPNPKVGTVTMDVSKAVRELKSGKIEFRVEKTGIIHAPIGRASFGAEKLEENARTLVDAIMKAKPAAVKGQYLRKFALATTMGPSVRIDVSRLLTVAEKAS